MILKGYRIEGHYLMHDDMLEALSYEQLWEMLGDIPTDDDEDIEEGFLDFPIGTHRYEIWHWFEKTFDISIAEDLMGLTK